MVRERKFSSKFSLLYSVAQSKTLAAVSSLGKSREIEEKKKKKEKEKEKKKPREIY